MTNYHFVWIPKYRKHLLKGKVVRVLKDILYGQSLEVMPDHIHFFISALPKWNPSKIVNILKGNTSRQLRLCFPELKHLGYPTRKRYKSLWADGYYVGSAGHVSQESVKRYILEQQGKDIFEYNIYGHPNKQLTIGDFNA